MTLDNPPQGATKQLFVPVSDGSDYPNPILYHDAALINAAGEFAIVSFRIPHDYNSLVTLQLIIYPQATDTMRFDYSFIYGSIGQAINTHSEQLEDNDIVCVQNELKALDMSAVPTALTVGDYVGFRTICDGANTPNAYVLGILFRYS